MQSQVEGRMMSLLAHTKTRMLSTVGEVSQRLDQGLEAIASRMIMASTCHTWAVIQRLFQEVQAKFDQAQVKLQQKQIET